MEVLFSVERVRYPDSGGVIFHQTDVPPGLPAWFGSPSSRVASMFEPVTLPCRIVISCASAKLSFAGAAAQADQHMVVEQTRLAAPHSVHALSIVFIVLFLQEGYRAGAR